MMVADTGSPGVGFVVGQGEMADRIRALDWSATPLGALHAWPPALRMAVNLCLASTVPMNVLWGPRHTQVYNDAYRMACGDAHPGALGEDFRARWAGAWPAIGAAFERALGGESVLLENAALVLARDGRAEEAFFTLSFSPLADEDGKVAGLLHTFVETTATVLAQRRSEEVARSEARLRTIFEASQRVQGLLAPDGTVLDANATALAAMGATREQVLGQPFWATPWFTGTQDMEATVRAAVGRAAAGETVRQDLHLQLPRAGWRHFDFTLRPVLDAQGAVTAIVPEAVDITERRTAEAALRQAQKLEAIGRLTGGIAHDFNNLLMVISGGISVIDRHPDKERRESVLQGMRRAVERGSALTRQMLTFGSRKDLSPRALDLATHLRGLQQALDRALDGTVRVHMEFDAGLWVVEVDPSELEMTLMNVCLNARDAMPEGGFITISVRNEDLAVGGPQLPAGSYVRLAVQDTGSGMPPEVLAHAFDPFFTTKSIGKGSGVGLAQVYGFAKDAGGLAEIESTVGMGTRVSLLLPRSRKTPESAAAAVPGTIETARSAHGTVLMVEDDDDVAALVQEMLMRLGYEAIRAASAVGALGALQNDRRVDVVFSDIMMPGSMNGVQLAREIRRRRPALPVVLTSGYAESFRHEVDAEGLLMLPKPYGMQELGQAMQRAIRGRLQ